jgi:hypothetical protein
MPIIPWYVPEKKKGGEGCVKYRMRNLNLTQCRVEPQRNSIAGWRETLAKPGVAFCCLVGWCDQTLYMVSSVKPAASSTWSFTSQAIRVMDLATLDPIAMDPLIEHAPNGVYWTLSYDRGVRLRVMPIVSRHAHSPVPCISLGALLKDGLWLCWQNSDAGFSAVFFDK